MNWFLIAAAVVHILRNVPDVVDDVEDIYDKLTGTEKPPAAIDDSVKAAIAVARPS